MIFYDLNQDRDKARYAEEEQAHFRERHAAYGHALKASEHALDQTAELDWPPGAHREALTAHNHAKRGRHAEAATAHRQARYLHKNVVRKKEDEGEHYYRMMSPQDVAKSQHRVYLHSQAAELHGQAAEYHDALAKLKGS
jgi:hypothetical protein